MRTIVLPPKTFIPELVAMIYAPSVVKKLKEVQLLTKLVEYSTGDYLVVSEVKKGIMADLNLTENHFRQLIHKLSKAGHIRNDNGVIQLHPNYKAINRCEGKLLIQQLDDDLLKDENVLRQIRDSKS